MPDESWHWERPQHRHHSPIIWLAVSWLVIVIAVGYLGWHVLRAWGGG
jgi:hypothetical protein